jgi:transcription initiation factor TFIID TATA-box-binding protein
MKEDVQETFQVVNIVASGLVADSFDLVSLSKTIEDCKFDSNRFPGAVLRIQDPKFVTLIFSSGKVILTGFKNLNNVTIGLHKFLDIINEVGLSHIDDPQVKITNIVCSYYIGYPCNLNKIMMAFNCENVEYEPEQFPALVYRIPDPKLVFLIFATGNIILAGGKNFEDVKRGLTVIKEKINSIM